MPSRSERRIARAALKLINYKSKNIRFIQSVKESLDKTPKMPALTCPCKIPVIPSVAPCGDAYMLWSLDKVDKEGNWSWGPRGWETHVWDKKIEPFFREYEKKLWKTILTETTYNKKMGRNHQKHIYYSLIDLLQKNPEVYERLEELELEDCGDGKIFRFRVTGKIRLYGFLFGPIFGFVWYDPIHMIWPIGH